MNHPKVREFGRDGLHPSLRLVRIRQFVAVWWSSWATRITGAATAPFSLLALYTSNKIYHTIWLIFAFGCAVYTFYGIWLNERLALEAEQAKNQLPIIRTDVEKVYVTAMGRAVCHVYLLTTLHNVNGAVPTAIKRFELTLRSRGRDYVGRELIVATYEQTCLRSSRLRIDEPLSDRNRLIDLHDVVEKLSALQRGIPARGWLGFIFAEELPPWPWEVAKNDKGAAVAHLDIDRVVEAVTLTVVDAFGQRHEICVKPPWRTLGIAFDGTPLGRDTWMYEGKNF